MRTASPRAWRSPVTGAILRPEGDAVLRDSDGRRWPVVDGIPFLRTGREALIAEALARLDEGDPLAACAVLLGDQDEWWTGATPSFEARLSLVREGARLNLREAMDRLAFDRVGTYFAHRWSDPTYLAGLKLLDAHWRPARDAFELACGIGHYGRDLLRHGVSYTGGDVVFAKLWLARHWVVGPTAQLVCFDAAAPWPEAEPRFDLVFCHDAFYFLPAKHEVLERLRGLRTSSGRLALGHIHNSAAHNLSAGRAVSAGEMARFFPGGTFYDDAELTRAVAENRAPRPATLNNLGDADAFAAEDAPATAPTSAALLSVPAPDAVLRLNPLYRAEPEFYEVAWPSPRYADEYGPLATYPATLPRRGELPAAPDDAAPGWLARRRVLVDLPERW